MSTLDNDLEYHETPQEELADPSMQGKTNSSFEEYHLNESLMKAISSFGFEHPSIVQQQCIPQAILGTDVVCQALSGMGKTAVFVLSILHQLATKDTEGKTACLVVCHNRELARQIKNEFVRFSSNFEKAPTVAVMVGGDPIRIQKKIAKENPTIVVGTPGRLAHLVDEGDLKLDSVKHFVVDECDAVLKADDRAKGGDDPLEMRRKLQKLYMTCPREKQVLMFTATLDEATKTLCKKFMSDPVEVLVESEVSLNLVNLKQYFVKLTAAQKVKKLIDILDNFQFNQVIIFVQKPQHVTMLNKILKKERFPSIMVHGNMRQGARTKNCMRFKSMEDGVRIMIATNILARGVDFEHVNVVINFDAPLNTDLYLHKVARAGRFGTKGLAITFLSSEEETELLNGAQKRFNVSIEELPEALDESEYSEETQKAEASEDTTKAE